MPDAGDGPARVVIAVDGPSGSGKTTLAEQLGAALGAPVVHLDDLYPGWDGLERGVDRLLDGVLRPLAQGAPTVTEYRWDWAAGRDGAPVTRPAAPVTVVEGAGCGALRCAPYLSVLLWLDGPEPVRRARALARDGAMFAPHWDRWAAQEHTHFAREGTRARADAVLTGATEIGVSAAGGPASVEP